MKKLSSSALMLIVGALMSPSCFSHVEVRDLPTRALAMGEWVDVEVPVTNAGETPVRLDRQRPSAAHGMRVQGLPVVLAPGERRTLQVSGQAGTRLGEHSNVIDLADEASQTVLRFRVPVLVYSRFEPQRPGVDFGVVEAGTFIEKSIRISSSDLVGFKLRVAESQRSPLAVRVDEATQQVTLSPRAELGWGTYRGVVELLTGRSAQPRVPVEYSFEVRGAVVPSTYALEMGLQRKSQTAWFPVLLQGAGSSPLRLGSVNYDGAPLEVRQSQCPDRSGNCRLIEVRLVDTDDTGVVGGQLSIELPDHRQTLKIDYGAFLIKADTQVRQLEPVSEEAEDGGLARTLGEISANSHEPIMMPTPEGSGPLLKWTVRNEQALFGYLVYRAESGSGPFVRQNADVILKLSSEEPRPVEYRWRDQQATPGRDYWYKVAVLHRSGLREDLTPAIRKAAQP